MHGTKPTKGMTDTDNPAGLSRLTQSVVMHRAELPVLLQRTACLAELVDDVADQAQLLALSLALARERTGDSDEKLARMADRVQMLVTSAGAVVASANSVLNRLHMPLPGEPGAKDSALPDGVADELLELTGKARDVSRLMVDTLDVVSWVPSGSLADEHDSDEAIAFCPSDVEKHLYRSATSLADLAQDMQDQLEMVDSEGG
jgi:hypothetical protein